MYRAFGSKFELRSLKFRPRFFSGLRVICSVERLQLMKTLLGGVGALVVLTAGGMTGPVASAARDESAAQTSKTSATKPTVKPEELDQLFAPIALYPDPLLAQM